ncbi:MAG: sugar phosphate nucleotidyltransferase [Gammaproteobacteria bacterium]
MCRAFLRTRYPPTGTSSTLSTRKHRPPTRAVLLSAGQGRRLLPLTESRPKCLLSVAGKSIMEWQIDALLGAGIEEVVVVTGYRTDLVEERLRQRYPGLPVRAEFNPFFDISDNLASCWMARAAMDRDFLLLNGDILFEPPVLEQVLASPASPITLTVNYKSAYDDDDMKVQLDGALVRHVSKSLAPPQVDCESIGMIYFREHGPRLFRCAIENALRHPTSLRLWYLSVINTLAADRLVSACSISGLRWAEIDFPADLKSAESLFAFRSGVRTAPAPTARNASRFN